MRRSIVQIFLLLILQFLPQFAQQIIGQESFPDMGILFNQSNVPRIDITIHPDTLDLILLEGNEGSNIEYMATFSFIDGNFMESIDSVGFRLRGNTSRNSAKKSFKVSLNRFLPGQKFDGVEKINLNGEHNDPSISRAFICWNIFREAGVPAPRSNHIEFYINNEYRGLYLNVEHIDEEFTELRFGNRDGNLFKCLWPADLVYKGSDPDLYKFESNGRQAYALKRIEGEGDYSDLAKFIDVLNNTPIEDLPKDLNKVFNINSYLKNLAAEVLLGHWDAYAYLKNNYYLYHNQGTGKFEYIPYDTDNTLGIDFFGIDWSNRDIYNWSNQSENRPLVNRLLQNQIFLDRYSFYLDKIIQEVYNSSNMNPIISEIRTRIDAAAESDSYRSFDYAFSYEDFYNSFDFASAGPAKYGIRDFISLRNTSASQQLELNSIDPIISLLSVNRPNLGESSKIEFLVEDDNDISDVKIWFADQEEFIEYSPTNHGDGLFSFSYPGLTEDGEHSFYITATDSEMNISRDPVENYYSIKYGLSSFYTSELSNNLLLFPNPVTDYLLISYAGGQANYQYFIYDLQGRIHQYGESKLPENRINIRDDMKGGVYLIELRFLSGSYENQNLYSKFILSR